MLIKIYLSLLSNLFYVCITMKYEARTSTMFLTNPPIQIFHQCNETQNSEHPWDHIKASAIHRCPLYVGFRQRGFL